MTLKIIGKFSLDSIVKSLKSFWVTVFLCFCAFVLIGIAAYTYDLTQYGKKLVDKSLQKGIEGTGIIQINFDMQGTKEDVMSMHNKIYQFEKQAYQLNTIEAIGSYCYAGNDIEELKELREIQNKFGKTNQNYSSTELEFLGMNFEMIKLCKLSIERGTNPSQLNQREDVIPLYLGSNFSKVPIGTTYIQKDDKGETITEYRVMGILKSGSEWIAERVLYTTEYLQLDNTVPLDNLVICVLPGETGVTGLEWSYTLVDGISFEETEKQLKELAKEYDLEITFGRVDSVFAEKEKANSKIISYSLKICFIVSISAFVVMLCIQLAGILNNLSDYGVFYANGASTLDLLLVLFWENMIKIVTAFILAALACYGLVHRYFGWSYSYMQEIAKNILFQDTYWKMAGVAFVLVISASIIPMCVLKRMQPVTLIGGNDV